MRRKVLMAAGCALGVSLWVAAGVVGYDWGRRTAEFHNARDRLGDGELGRKSAEEFDKMKEDAERRATDGQPRP